MSPETTVLFLLAALAYLAWGRVVVGVAHMRDPAARKAPQLMQFLGVVLWLPLSIYNRVSGRRSR